MQPMQFPDTPSRFAYHIPIRFLLMISFQFVLQYHSTPKETKPAQDSYNGRIAGRSMHRQMYNIFL